MREVFHSISDISPEGGNVAAPTVRSVSNALRGKLRNIRRVHLMAATPWPGIAPVSSGNFLLHNVSFGNRRGAFESGVCRNCRLSNSCLPYWKVSGRFGIKAVMAAIMAVTAVVAVGGWWWWWWWWLVVVWQRRESGATTYILLLWGARACNW